MAEVERIGETCHPKQKATASFRLDTGSAKVAFGIRDVRQDGDTVVFCLDTCERVSAPLALVERIWPFWRDMQALYL